MKLLCWIGLHMWVTTFNPNGRKRRICPTCGRAQTYLPGYIREPGRWVEGDWR